MNSTLATFSDYALYSSMAVFALAMIGYAGYLAGLVPSRSAAEVSTPVTVGVGGPSGQAAVGSDDPTSAGDDDVPIRARKAGGIAQALLFLGTAFLLAAVALRGIAVERWPLGNMYEFGIFSCLFVMLGYVALATKRDLRWLGLFVTLPVLLTLGLASTIWYTEASGVMPALQSYWLVIHVTVATVAVGVFTLGAVAAALYLWQQRAESAQKPSFLNRFPDSKSLERFTYSLHIVGFPLWTFSVMAGAIWARQAWGSYWNWDPKEVVSFVIWVVYAAYLHARATSGWSRAQATWVALLGFGCIVANYAIVNVYFVSQHSYSGL